MEWFKIDLIFTKTLSLSGDDEDESWRMPKDDDIYQVESGYFNLAEDPIVQLNPRAFIPKDGKNRKQFTEVVFLSGNVSYAVGNPELVMSKVSEYVKSQS